MWGIRLVAIHFQISDFYFKIKKKTFEFSPFKKIIYFSREKYVFTCFTEFQVYHVWSCSGATDLGVLIKQCYVGDNNNQVAVIDDKGLVKSLHKKTEISIFIIHQFFS